MCVVVKTDLVLLFSRRFGVGGEIIAMVMFPDKSGVRCDVHFSKKSDYWNMFLDGYPFKV